MVNSLNIISEYDFTYFDDCTVTLSMTCGREARLMMDCGGDAGTVQAMR